MKFDIKYSKNSVDTTNCNCSQKNNGLVLKGKIINNRKTKPTPNPNLPVTRKIHPLKTDNCDTNFVSGQDPNLKNPITINNKQKFKVSNTQKIPLLKIIFRYILKLFT